MTASAASAMAARRVGARLSAWIDGEGDLRHLELLRIAAGFLVLAHLRPFLAAAASGVVYVDRFHDPYASWYPEAPRSLYIALLWLTVPAAVALSAGFLTRWASAYSSLFVGYNLFLSRTHFGHNRAFLLVLLLGLALLPVGRALAIDPVLRSRRGRERRPATGPLWPVLLMRIEIVAVYFGSGLSKLVDADWFGGTVTRLRVDQWEAAAAARGVPDWILDVIATDAFHVVFAKGVVFTELAIAIGLVGLRTRVGAMWLAVWFHVAIELTASVQVFSYAGVAALLIWVTPSPGAWLVIVDGDTRFGRAMHRMVAGLDWTARFRVESIEGMSGRGDRVIVVDATGARRRGPAALLAVATRLPALFPFVAPFNVPPLRMVWDGVAGWLVGPHET